MLPATLPATTAAPLRTPSAASARFGKGRGVASVSLTTGFCSRGGIPDPWIVYKPTPTPYFLHHGDKCPVLPDRIAL
jgi:hypothetical protein